MPSFKINLNTDKYNGRRNIHKNIVKNNCKFYLLCSSLSFQKNVWRNKLEFAVIVVKTYDLNPGSEINDRMENQ